MAKWWQIEQSIEKYWEVMGQLSIFHDTNPGVSTYVCLFAGLCLLLRLSSLAFHPNQTIWWASLLHFEIVLVM